MRKRPIRYWPNKAAAGVAYLVCAGLLGQVLGGLHVSSAAATIPVYSVHVVRTFPHDSTAFTEGLFYKDGYLYESTGLAGQSSVRKVRIETGEILQERKLDPAYFGEGIVAWKDRLIQLTWRNGIGFVYDLARMRPRATFHYAGEGWALTRDAHRIIMSDGTSTLRLLNPETLAQTGALKVTADGCPLLNINELEWVKGEIYANIWLTDFIARIDAHTGRVLAFLDLGDIGPPARSGTDAVLNGIAFDAASDRLFVTGKLWPQVYEIRAGRIRSAMVGENCAANAVRPE